MAPGGGAVRGLWPRACAGPRRAPPPGSVCGPLAERDCASAGPDCGPDHGRGPNCEPDDASGDPRRREPAYGPGRDTGCGPVPGPGRAAGLEAVPGPESDRDCGYGP